MRRAELCRRARTARSGAALSAAALLVSAAGLSVAGTAGAAPPPSTTAPTGITASASTDNTGLGGAVPVVLVTAGGQFSLTVTLTPTDATFTSATTLALTASVAGGRPAGSVTPGSVVMPAGVNSATFSASYSAVQNGVQITAAVAKAKGKLAGVAPGTTDPFDVLKVLETFGSNNPQLTTGLGVGDANCTAVSTESECGTLVLSHGFSSQAGALSLGTCSSDLNCTTGSQVVQFIAQLDTYSSTDPALLIIRCSKQQCPGKAIKNYTLKVSFSASGPLNMVAAPCVSKGVARDAAGNDFCTDYVSSRRDNAGDVLLYLLFTHDMRAST